MLTDLNARHVGADGGKLSPDFRGGVHLQVKHVLMGRSAWQVDQNECLLGFACSLGGFGTQQLGQGEAAQAETTEAQEGAPRQAVAEGTS